MVEPDVPVWWKRTYLCGGSVEGDAQDGTDPEAGSDGERDQHHPSHPYAALRVHSIAPPHQRDAGVDELQKDRTR